jgi:hypothetical protein
MLPIRERNAIWNTYREGQEIDKQPSKEYIEAAKRAIYYIDCLEAGSTPERLPLAEIAPQRKRVRFDGDTQ